MDAGTITVAPRVAQLTPEQLEIRKTGIGSSEIAAICGLDPYRRAIDVWAEKLGLTPPFEGNRFTKWGQRLEAPIADQYAEDRSVVLVQVGTLRHPKHAFMVDTPDRIALRSGTSTADRENWERVVEIKNVSARLAGKWGHDDDVPEEKLVQCAWHMAVTDLDRCDLAALIGGNDDRCHTLHRDRELEERLIDAGARFWTDHVLSREPPAIDGSDSWASFLKRQFPREQGEMLPADPTTERLARRVAALRRAAKTIEERKQLHENQLKAALGDAIGVEGRGVKATWKWQKGSTYTVTREATRVLRVTIAGEK
jgi:putative phage-type endonuclease